MRTRLVGLVLGLLLMASITFSAAPEPTWVNPNVGNETARALVANMTDDEIDVLLLSHGVPHGELAEYDQFSKARLAEFYVQYPNARYGGGRRYRSPITPDSGVQSLEMSEDELEIIVRWQDACPSCPERDQRLWFETDWRWLHNPWNRWQDQVAFTWTDAMRLAGTGRGHLAQYWIDGMLIQEKTAPFQSDFTMGVGFIHDMRIGPGEHRGYARVAVYKERGSSPHTGTFGMKYFHRQIAFGGSRLSWDAKGPGGGDAG